MQGILGCQVWLLIQNSPTSESFQDISFDVYLGRYIGQRAALKMFDTFDGIQTVFGGFNIAGGFLWGENASQAC